MTTPKPFDHTWEDLADLEQLADIIPPAPPMKDYVITVKQLVATEDLDPADRDDSPAKYRYGVKAHHEEEALDFFHECVPVAILNHFDIEAHEWEESDGQDLVELTPDHLFTNFQKDIE